MRKLHTVACLLAVSVLTLTGIADSLAQNPDPTAAAKFGWGFRNFKDTEYSWDLFSHTFFGVPLDPDGIWLTSTFDKLFYENAYRFALPQSNGNCFGLSLLSILMNKFGGYYGYCAPPIAWKGDVGGYPNTGNGPTDTALHRIINIMHGRQLALAAVESYIDQGMGGKSQFCNNGVQLIEQTLAKEGPCIVSITKGLNPKGGGHALVAYGVTYSGSSAKIWVVDSYRLWAVGTAEDSGWYAGDNNYIDCDLSNGKWSFAMAQGDVWPVGGSGHLIAIPASLVGPPGRVPSSLGLSLGELLSKLMLFDGAGQSGEEGFLMHKTLPPEVGGTAGSRGPFPPTSPNQGDR